RDFCSSRCAPVVVRPRVRPPLASGLIVGRREICAFIDPGQALPRTLHGVEGGGGERMSAPQVAPEAELPCFIVRGCIATVFCVLTAHVWLCWDDLIASVRGLRRELQRLGAPPGLCTSFDTRLCTELHRVRAARGRFFLDTMQVPVTTLSLLVLIGMSLRGKHDLGLALSAVFVLLRYMALLYVNHCIKFSRIPSVDISFVFKLTMSLLVLRTHFTDTDDFLMNGGLRCGLRVFNAILLLDFKTAWRWNVLFSAVVCITAWNRSDHLCTDGRHAMDAFASHCLSEAGTFATVCAVPLLLETCEKDRIKASLESSESGKAYQAVQSMLRVFCDAQLRICPQSSIIAHSPHLLHLLGLGDQAGEPRRSLRGDSFLRYVDELDQQRFQDFVAAAVVPQLGGDSSSRSAAPPGESLGTDGSGVGLATSIQVSLRTEGGGLPAPVELSLFLYDPRPRRQRRPRVPDGDPRDQGCSAAGGMHGGPRGRGLAATCGGRAREPRARPRGEPRRLPREDKRALYQSRCGASSARLSARPTSSRTRSIPPPQSAWAPWQPPVLHVCEKRSDGSRSSSSGRSGTSSRSSAPDAGQVSSVSLRLDSATREFRVQEMLLRFQAGPRAPCLKQWLPRDALAQIEKRCQALMHAKWYEDVEEVDSALGALEFCRHGSAFMLAERAELVVPGSLADPANSSDDDPADDVPSNLMTTMTQPSAPEENADDDLDLMVAMNLHEVSTIPCPGRSDVPGSRGGCDRSASRCRGWTQSPSRRQARRAEPTTRRHAPLLSFLTPRLPSSGALAPPGVFLPCQSFSSPVILRLDFSDPRPQRFLSGCACSRPAFAGIRSRSRLVSCRTRAPCSSFWRGMFHTSSAARCERQPPPSTIQWTCFGEVSRR
ncbi:unnamed protein product, partial [Prorocentrum cordatum]